MNIQEKTVIIQNETQKKSDESEKPNETQNEITTILKAQISTLPPATTDCDSQENKPDKKKII